MSYYDKLITPNKKNHSKSNQSKQAPIQRSSHPANIIQSNRMYPQSITHADAMVLQRTIGNQPVCQLMRKINLVNDNTNPVQREANKMGGKALQHIASLHPMVSMHKLDTPNITMQLKGMKIGRKEYAGGTCWMDTSKCDLNIRAGIGDIRIGDDIIKLICNKWAKQELIFKDRDNFIEELSLLLSDWSNQCYLYMLNPDGSTLNKDSVTPKDKNIKFYSARPIDQIIDLYVWAKENGKEDCLEDFPTYMPEKPVTKEDNNQFSGHLGDKTIALKYLKSKGESTGIIMIEFTHEGSSKLLNHIKTGEHDRGGDRKPRPGREIVTKCDSELFSLALNHFGLNYLKDKISRIKLIVAPPILSQYASATVPSTSSSTV